ncbi:leucine-rich repeat and calponin homology domain-containing protein 2-like isoform X1 [Saccostrea echinata]|uniref:leucine-rich repeat and calponin homology domain-containing protein 2-like isoform X1 n=1 Tax=Saccostrea echinata TaxID=191078 RepID=UPI002A81EF21|nr:leucine-rich repeat and calponin homology domain-containing protein 2-like isoform X1 [Saccostrea echinata]
MASTFTGGSANTVSRPLDRIFDDAQHTGEIILCGRKLKEYPKIAGKYDLVDTVSIDLSKNRFTEIPPEIFEYRSAECLNCYHNAIKFVPEALLQLQNLTHLCLSRNQLTVIPPFIKCLQALEVFLASHNKLVSLPEEIGELKRLMEIDVSCNEISHLPSQIGDLKSMQCLNVRRNLLIELPLELSKLHLRKLDFSSNKISTIPTAFRKIETLEEMILDHNPLTMPPAHVCIKGKRHIMKLLQIEAIKEEQKRDNDAEMKKLVRKSMPPQNSIPAEEFMTDPSQEKWKRHTVLSNDSGYSTTDSLEKIGWSPNVSEALSQWQHGDSSAYKGVVANGPEIDPPRRGLESRPPPINTAYSGPNTNQFSPKTPTPGYPPTELSPPPGELSPQSPLTPVTPRMPISASDQAFSENEFSRELNRQKVEYERKKKTAEQLRIQQEEEERETRRKAAQKIQEEQKALLEKQWQDSRTNEAVKVEENRRPEKKQEEPKALLPRPEQEVNKGSQDARRSVENNYKVYPSRHPADFNTPTPFGYKPQYNHGNVSPYSPVSPGSPPGYSYGQTVHSPHRNEHHNPQGVSPYGVSPHGASPQGVSPNRPTYNPRATGNPPRTLALDSQHYSGYVQDASMGNSSSSIHSPPHVSPHSAKTSVPHYAAPLQRNSRNAMDTYSMNYRQPNQTTNSVNKEEQKPTNVPLRRQGSDSNQNPTSNPSTAKPSGAKTGASGAHSSTSRIKKPVSRGIPVLRHKPGSTVNGGNSPGISPSPSPRSSLGSTGTNSPSSSTSSLHKIGDKGGPATRRTKTTATTPSSGRGAAGGERSNVPPPTPVRSSSNRPSTGSSQEDGKPGKGGRTTPGEDKRQVQKNAVNSLIAKRDDKKTPPNPPLRTSYGAASRRSAGSGSAMRVIDSYKDDGNFTLRRQEERMKEEAEQLNRLRMTIEKRLKVTLPDNLPESLRDGVLLCQFANNIRPRSVLSIHVPSPAVPKLTMAKCRKNVENFLEACRKVGVGKEQICSSQDILDESGIIRVSITIAALVAISTNPKASAV